MSFNSIAKSFFNFRCPKSLNPNVKPFYINKPHLLTLGSVTLKPLVSANPFIIMAKQKTGTLPPPSPWEPAPSKFKELISNYSKCSKEERENDFWEFKAGYNSKLDLYEEQNIVPNSVLKIWINVNLDVDSNVIMDYFADEKPNYVINVYLGFLRKAFINHKCNECFFNSLVFMDWLEIDEELTMAQRTSLEAAFNFIMVRIKMAYQKKRDEDARKAIKNTAKKDFGKRRAKRAVRTAKRRAARRLRRGS